MQSSCTRDRPRLQRVEFQPARADRLQDVNTFSSVSSRSESPVLMLLAGRLGWTCVRLLHHKLTSDLRAGQHFHSAEESDNKLTQNVTEIAFTAIFTGLMKSCYRGASERERFVAGLKEAEVRSIHRWMHRGSAGRACLNHNDSSNKEILPTHTQTHTCINTEIIWEEQRSKSESGMARYGDKSSETEDDNRESERYGRRSNCLGEKKGLAARWGGVGGRVNV